MKAEIRKDLTDIVQGTIKEYNSYDSENKGKVLGNLIKEINLVKDLENQTIDNSIKRRRLKLDEAKLALDQDKIQLEKTKIDIDARKLDLEEKKFNFGNQIEKTKIDIEVRKLELEEKKFDFENQKFNSEVKRSKNDKIFNIGMKVIEVLIPLTIYTGLSFMHLRLVYKDDGIAPSSMKDFIKYVVKK